MLEGLTDSLGGSTHGMRRSFGPALTGQPAGDAADDHDDDGRWHWRGLHIPEEADQSHSKRQQTQVACFEDLDDLREAQPRKAEAGQCHHQGGLWCHTHDQRPRKATESCNSTTDEVGNTANSPCVHNSIAPVHAIAGCCLCRFRHDTKDKRKRGRRVDAIWYCAHVGVPFFPHKPDRHPRIIEVSENHRDAHARNYFAVDHLDDKLIEFVLVADILEGRGHHLRHGPNEAHHGPRDLT
mmetsp:Transcript_59158/g.138420  ORF Transcript_59158/g.138420 Transcript_59158/m.138420 type:complete len:239 (+) Transcript_59158:1087-1803(+)